jgi:catechol 2,3-dioxygenase-like lactoylglutathione lyase family enzyme
MPRFELARGLLDPGLFSDAAPKMWSFYEDVVGLPRIESLRHSPTYQEVFFALPPGKLKVQSFDTPMGPAVTGYKELRIARDGLAAAKTLRDPDGLVVTLVPKGERGITSAGIVVGVRDVDAQERFLIEGLGARPHAGGLRVGDTQLFVEEDPNARPATPTCRRGFVYITLITHDCRAAHAALVAAGGEHSARVLRLMDRCLFSWVRDPAGNWIEIIQYAELSGPLPEVERLADHWAEVEAWRDHGTPY